MKLSLDVVSHSSDFVTMGVTDVMFGAVGRMLTEMELLSGVFMVSLAEDQVNFSEDIADVALGGAETGREFSFAMDEFQDNLETELWIRGWLVGDVGMGLGFLEKLFVDELLKTSVVPWCLFNGSQREELLASGLEVSLFSLFELKFLSLSKGTDSFSIVFEPAAMLCVVFLSRLSFPWLPINSKLNKFEINRILAEVNIVAFFGIGVIKRNLKKSK